MAYSTDPAAYTDIQAVLDAAKARGTVTYMVYEDHGTAVNWRHKAYSFRKALIRAAQRKVGMTEGFFPSTPYDNMLLRVEDKRVSINWLPEATGVLTGADGQPIP